MRRLQAGGVLALFIWLAAAAAGAIWQSSHAAHGKGKPMSRQTGHAGIALIKQHEGCVLSTYRCPANKCTIGYGHTGNDVKPGMTITADRAEELLRHDLTVAEAAIARLVTVPLSQPQHDAIASLIFNIGVPAFAKSTMLKLINRKDFTKAADEFARWSHVNGVLLPGLLKRRKAEMTLFLLRT